MGLNRIALNWRLAGEEKDSLRRTLELITSKWPHQQLGTLRVDDWLLDKGDHWHSSFEGQYHHMGTTRMADDPKLGVVDRDCRVHGVSNLFMAGSSVFPTSGSANPTLTIVALALRLAGTLKSELEGN